MESWEPEEWKVVLQDLYRHPKSSRFLEAIEEPTIKEIRVAAAQKIRRTMQAGE